MPSDDARAKKRAWEQANYDRFKAAKNERSRQWRLDHPEEAREHMQRYRDAHREELRQRARAYRAANPARIQEIRAKSKLRTRATNRAYYLKQRASVLAAYGGACVCCGESNAAFLTIDHIHNDGKTDRGPGGQGSGIAQIRWLLKHGCPKDRFQVLCYNCNCSKQHDTAGHRAAHSRAFLIDGGAARDQQLAEQDRQVRGRVTGTPPRASPQPEHPSASAAPRDGSGAR